MNQEKNFNLRAMRAEFVLTRSDVAKGHPQCYQDPYRIAVGPHQGQKTFTL